MRSGKILSPSCGFDTSFLIHLGLVVLAMLLLSNPDEMVAEGVCTFPMLGGLTSRVEATGLGRERVVIELVWSGRKRCCSSYDDIMA